MCNDIVICIVFITESEVHVIQTTVDAVTSMNDEIFVLRRPSHQQLDVFNAMTKTFKRKLHIKDFSDDTTFSCGLTSCTDDNCLYVCDSLRRYIHRLDLDSVTPEEPTSWQVKADEDDAVTSLSMNSTREVLVTCSKTHRILTYSKLGKLMHEIRLDQTEVTRPQHAIQLQDNRFIVSHSGPVYGVSVVNKHGKVELTYRNESVEKNDTRFISPRQLAVADNGSILVADNGFNRIVALNPTLDVARVVTLPGVNDLIGPWSIYLDSKRDRLLIGEERGGRVYAFNGASAILSHASEIIE